MPPRPGRAVLVVSLLLLAFGWVQAAEPELASLVEPYLKARGDQVLGSVAALAYVEPVRPSAGPSPKAAVSVVLLPYSAALEAELDEVKAGLRDTLDGYTRAVARIESARVEYERSLVAAGAGELVRNGATDAQGTARLADLPAGEWLLLAWQEGGHMSKRFKMRDLDARRYPDVQTNVTYSVVTYWRSRVAVRKGETAEIRMTDRNAWMTAARQEGGTPVPSPPKSGAPKRR